MTALPVHVGLVSTSQKVAADALAEVAAALQSQVARDFSPIWKTNAVVASFASVDAIPAGYWPILVADNLNEPGALGYHTTKHRQPISYVQADANWTVTASHELLEMLADPFGNRLWVAQAPDGSGERVRILVEVCDPCEATSYDIGGVAVSDFALPSWYHTARRFGNEYSFQGVLKASRQIGPGGYVSWVGPDGQWKQETFWGTQPQTQVLGEIESFAKSGESLREAVDRHVRETRPA